MPDIKRNDETPTQDGQPPKGKALIEKVERKPLPGAFRKEQSMQVHFGNVEGLKLKLLENISNGIQTLCDILDMDGKKRDEIVNKRMQNG